MSNENKINEPLNNPLSDDLVNEILEQVTPNQIIDHSQVLISAGDGLSGGGSIVASRMLTNSDKGSTARTAHELAFNHSNYDTAYSKITNLDIVNVKDFGAVGDGIADDTAAIQAAIYVGFYIFFPYGNYKITSKLIIPSNKRLFGINKTGSILTLAADIPAFEIDSINDVEIQDFLIMACPTQSVPVISIIASTAVVARINFRGVQISGNYTNFKVIQLLASATPYGIWNCSFEDISASAVGTVVYMKTAASGTWITQCRFERFFVGNFITGIEIDADTGDGCSANIFRSWGAQSSPGVTLWGLKIIDVATAGYSQRNVLDGVVFYDMPANGLYYDIGYNVLGTEIREPIGDALVSQQYIDHGIKTHFISDNQFSDLMSSGHFLQIPTVGGWTAAVTGSGTTGQQASYNFTRTGVTVGSTARLFTEPICGFSSGSFFCINFSKPVVFTFNVSRATAEANAIGHIQLKTVTTEGNLAAQGFGVKIVNMALYGESFGSASGIVDLDTVLSDVGNVQIKIKHFPGLRTEWWVNGVFKAMQDDVTKIPFGLVVFSLVHSLITTVSNPSADAQMFLGQPRLWVGI